MKINSLSNKFPPALYELLLGAACYGLVIQLIIFVFFSNKVYDSIGLWLGIAIAAGMAVHMAYALDMGLSAFVSNASGYIRKHAMFRFLAVVIVFLLTAITNIGSPVACFAGIMGLKAGAYLQPLTHKVLKKILAVIAQRR